MKTIIWNSLPQAERRIALARPAQRNDASLCTAVRAIVDDVRARGWQSLAEQALRIDKAEPRLIAVAAAAAEARRTLNNEQLCAIQLAINNIRTFHENSIPAEQAVETMPGLIVRKIWRPMDRVGLYIPGGKTPLFSTLLMLAIPAQVAGVAEIIVTTPPREDGSLDPLIALAAEACGIASVWTMGGAQAIAALAFGAGDIAPVSKICGPGNAWVAGAKNYVASCPGGPAIDMPAGPSELLIIADDSADPGLIIADMLSQAEHDPSAQVLLATPSFYLADAVAAGLATAAATLPRAAIISAALANARILITTDMEEAIAIANLYAPEHLSLATMHPQTWIAAIVNAGAIFAGHGAAETFGDYLAGSSHVLPTDGAARAWSGISVHSFLKAITVQEVTPKAARALAGPAAVLARLEGLEAHARAADLRAEMTA